MNENASQLCPASVLARPASKEIRVPTAPHCENDERVTHVGPILTMRA